MIHGLDAFLTRGPDFYEERFWDWGEFVDAEAQRIFEAGIAKATFGDVAWGSLPSVTGMTAKTLLDSINEKLTDMWEAEGL